MKHPRTLLGFKEREGLASNHPLLNGGKYGSCVSKLTINGFGKGLQSTIINIELLVSRENAKRNTPRRGWLGG